MKQADADGQAFLRAALNDSLARYALVFVAGPTLPAWASTVEADCDGLGKSCLCVDYPHHLIEKLSRWDQL